MRKSRSVPILFFIFMAACKPSYQPQSIQFQDYHISNAYKIDSSFIPFLKPYRDSVNSTMSTILAEADTPLYKKQPEGELGNFLTDALLTMAQRKFSVHIDAAFLNHGGIRLSDLAQGPVTTGKIFELMPFDNIVSLQNINGVILQQFLDHVASLGGWPVSGLTMKIKNKKAIDVMIGDKPLDNNTNYNVVNSDYITSGGDNCAMLKTIPVVSTGYLVRDAFIDYIKELESEGKKIHAVLQNRVVNAE